MDQNNRPQGREKNVTDGGKGIHKRGEGLGTGKVGNKDYSGQASSGKNVKRAAAGGGGGLVMIIIVLLMIFKGGDLGSMLGGSSGDSGAGQWIGNSSNTSGYSANSETSADTSVAEGSRAKYTVLKGNNQDKITLMVYMCGTDLESKYGMASSDMEEMRQASESFGDSLNIIIYTGGCNNWKTKGISSSVNQ
ncbi:MAG: peptidase C11, partial [Ruminococcus sp.]|nr:peptidase C11 [Ruminococcus sp.]